jgi:lipopolysaccharide export system protein LptA
VWTPKRVLLLLTGSVVFFMGYAVYAFFLGNKDGLPQLPPEFWPSASVGPFTGPTSGQRRTDTERKLEQAFGADGDALKLAIKLELRTRGMVLATDEFKFTEDGRVELRPFRVALFGKAIGPDGTPEINTVRSDSAVLRFDAPVRNFQDLSSRKIIGATLNKNIIISNNRRTALPIDDLILTTVGPVEYDEGLGKIWTAAVVGIKDFQTEPPTLINATGMDVYLRKDKEPAAVRAASARGRPDSVSGVEKIRLRSGVVMHLYVDSQTSFLSTGKRPPAGPPGRAVALASAGPDAANRSGPTPAGPPPKSHILITCAGPFLYDMIHDHATFDEDPASPLKPVEVIRENRTATAQQSGLNDVLDCNHLELQFSRKAPAAGTTPAPPQSEMGGLTIETAHATAHKELTLFSDAETLEAHGNDLTYDTRTHTTVLKGEPETWTIKEGNDLHARELHLIERDGSQQITALGPGYIDLLDKKTGNSPLHARWRERLETGKDASAGANGAAGKADPMDVLTLTGKAEFDDDVHGQVLRGDRLKVWFKAAEHKPAPDGGGPEHLQPHHVEATGHVSAESPQMRIKPPTEQLMIWFIDVKARPADRPAAVGPTQPGRGGIVGPPAGPSVAGPVAAPTGEVRPGSTPPGQPAKAKKPIELSARSVEAHVLRFDNDHNELESLNCVGDVAVHQDAASPRDHGIDIRGRTLELHHYPEGHVLYVTDDVDLAQVQLDKTTILGPKITIDQKTDEALVHGAGVMKMPATGDLSGGKPTRPGELTVRWQRSMRFSGKSGYFVGKVQANQGTGGMLCDDMQVILDRPITFREGGDKGGQGAKVDRVMCHTDVFVEDRTLDGTQLVGRQQLSAPEMDFDNATGTVEADGGGQGGVVRILRYGTADESPFAAPSAGPQQPARTPGASKPELKLTIVHYSGKLRADNNKHLAIFWDNVEVLHAPATPGMLRGDESMVLDKNHPPPGSLYLQSQKLVVLTHQEGAIKTQEMTATGNVVVRSDDQWYGNGAEMHYDEAKDTVVLRAGEYGFATLYRRPGPGLPYDKFEGKVITYWRRSNTAKVEGGNGAKFIQRQ